MKTDDLLTKINQNDLFKMLEIYDEYGESIHWLNSSNKGFLNLSKHYLISDEFANLSTNEKINILNNFESINCFLETLEHISSEYGLGVYHVDEK